MSEAAPNMNTRACEMSAVERLAQQWNSEPNYGTSAYDLARMYERTMKTMQLREAIEQDRAAEVRLVPVKQDGDAS